MEISVAQLLEFIFLVVAGILPIANPFSTAPLFVSLTAKLPPAEQISQAIRASRYMAIILIGAFFLGAAILDFFSITIPAIRLAGGLVILYIGFGMLFPKGQEVVEEVEVDPAKRQDFAFTPLAVPMLSGPRFDCGRARDVGPGCGAALGGGADRGRPGGDRRHLDHRSDRLAGAAKLPAHGRANGPGGY